jgi:hypothetical protein
MKAEVKNRDKKPRQKINFTNRTHKTSGCGTRKGLRLVAFLKSSLGAAAALGGADFVWGWESVAGRSCQL